MELATEFKLDPKHKINLSGGAIRQDDDTEFFATFTPGIAFSKLGWRVSVDVGGGIALLSDDKIGDHDFGGPFQFAAHIGINYKIGWNIVLGYRFYHMSDGGIFDGEGVNRHLFELSLQF